jgi:hypothetical protein
MGGRKVTHLKAWFATAFALAFLAGGGAGLVAERLLGNGDDRPPLADADGYLRVFEAQVGIANESQRTALRSAYEQYWHEFDELSRRIARQHQEELGALEKAFEQRVLQQLDERQRSVWLQKIGSAAAGGPVDSDASRDADPDGAGGK